MAPPGECLRDFCNVWLIGAVVCLLVAAGSDCSLARAVDGDSGGEGNDELTCLRSYNSDKSS